MDIIKKFDAPDPDENNKDLGADVNKALPGETKVPEEHKDHKSFKDKIKDALQEWSNDNEKDIEEDDNTPLRSGL